MKGIIFGRTLTDGSTTMTCAAPCFGYSFRLNTSVWELMKQAFPVTLSETIGAATLWLVGGVSIGVISALRRGSFFDRAATIFALAGVSLPVFFTAPAAAADLQLRPGLAAAVPERDQYVPFTENPALWFQNSDPALDIPGLPVRGPVRAVHPGEHAGDDGGGLHPDRHRQGPASAEPSSAGTACEPRSPRS